MKPGEWVRLTRLRPESPPGLRQFYGTMGQITQVQKTRTPDGVEEVRYVVQFAAGKPFWLPASDLTQ